MPLDAVYHLMKENVQDVEEGRNVLDGKKVGGQRQHIQLVTKEYFDAVSQMDISNVNDAVLGFCSLILPYAKAANNKPSSPEMSPKSWIPFMPRTELVTVYGAIKSNFPPGGKLFDILNTLACFKTGEYKNGKFGIRYAPPRKLATCLPS